MALALGFPLALEEGKIQGADVNPPYGPRANPCEISQNPDDPQTQEEEESVVLNHGYKVCSIIRATNEKYKWRSKNKISNGKG